MTTTNITPAQARRLCNLIDIGHEIGMGSDGEIVYALTKLSQAMTLLEMDWSLDFSGKQWNTAPVVAMLRDWADALEKLNDPI